MFRSLSSALLLGVERIRSDTRRSFVQTVSGVDLVAGPRTGGVQLMLYAVFRSGSATHTMRWESFQALARHPGVAWAVPLSHGDSYRGFPVLGTSRDYFKHYRYGEKQPQQAPTEPSMAGRKVRLPGFVIPLERKGEEVVEFLLVPYFGACIHTPPPPANQIIHAVSARPRGKMRSMDAFWVSGTLEIKRSETDWGGAGYRLRVEALQRYEEAPKK